MIILAVVFALSFGASITGPGHEASIYLHDLLFVLRGPVPVNKDIVIVAIDEPSFGVIGRQWPWPRELHAQLTDNLYRLGARVVAFDVIFAEASDPQNDQAFREVLSRHPGTVLASYYDTAQSDLFKRETFVVPHPDIFAPGTRTGFINMPVNEGGLIRKVKCHTQDQVCLSGAVYESFTHQKTDRRTQELLINFAGPPGTFDLISYYQVLDIAHLPDMFFKDKAVFVGFVSIIADVFSNRPDHFPVPWTRWGKGYMPGVEILATVLDNLLENNAIVPLPVWVTYLLSFLICTGLVLTSLSGHPKRSLPVWGVSGLLLTAVWYILFSKFNRLLSLPGIIFPSTAGTLAILTLYFFEIQREKLFIRKAFSTYVSPAVVKELEKNPEKLELGGEEREITAFFSDIQGFTSISEKMGPRELVNFLNEFLSEMSDIILDARGTVDKFEGDAIIAFFGAPQPMADHALHACAGTIKMHHRLTILNQGWRAKGLPEIKMRTGLCSGKAIVGNMGTRDRMDYTMMGDTVNIAARLEGANKIYGIYSLISETTKRQLPDTIVTRQIDTIRVVGRKEPMDIHQLLGYEEDISEQTFQVLELYARGLERYKSMDFSKAIDFFTAALSIDPEEQPSQTMLSRCQNFLQAPPGQGWDGVFTQQKK